jgi:indolepyruvate ferredoxin oxidoreductase alpha subunit
MLRTDRLLLSGNEAIALGALHAKVTLGTGYPGTPSTEILEEFFRLGGRAQWSPNEKVALEVAIGVAFAGGRALCTMKHVGLNVAADPFFTAAYTDLEGALVVVSADDPGMASSQNEQDNRRLAVAAGVPCLEPSDSQEAYDFVRAAIELSEAFKLPVMLRVTTRVCHSQSVVVPASEPLSPSTIGFASNVARRVMIPMHARPAHRRLREKLEQIARWSEDCALTQVTHASTELGIITSGVCYAHAREVAQNASFCKLGVTHPLPLEAIRAFRATVDKCVVIEEGDPYLADAINAAGIDVEGKPPQFRFGELNVDRLRRIFRGDLSPEPTLPAGKPPELCPGCSHRHVFEVLKRLDCIVSGDIGCYTLGVLPPFSAMDTQTCMGASIGTGLGLRHSLPPDDAKRVVSVIGDSTFIHSGITGLIEMVYNPPPTGHVVLILDNATTAMTGHQENPSTGRTLGGEPTNKVKIEDLARACGIADVTVIDVGSTRAEREFESVLRQRLHSQALSVIIARHPCLLIAPRLRHYEQQACLMEASDAKK